VIERALLAALIACALAIALGEIADRLNLGELPCEAQGWSTESCDKDRASKSTTTERTNR